MTSPGRWLRAAEGCLFAVLLLFLAGFGSGCFDERSLEWEGETWKLQFLKIADTVLIYVVTPDGRVAEIGDAGVPFGLVAKDGGYQPVPKGRFGSGGAATAGSHAYFLGDSPDLLFAIDQKSRRVAATVNLPPRPQRLAVSPDGQRVYVTHQAVEAGNPFFPQSPPRISVISTATHIIVDTINLPADKVPGKPVAGEDGRFLYVPHAGTFVSPAGFQGASLLVVDTRTRAVAAEIPLNIAGATINHLAITPDGALVYGTATQTIPARVFVFDTQERELTASFLAPGSTRDLLVDYTGTRLYVLTQNSVIAYDTAGNEELGRLLVRQNARLNVMGQSPDGRTLFVNDELTTSLYRIDKGSLQVAQEITTAGGRTPDSSWMLVIP